MAIAFQNERGFAGGGNFAFNVGASANRYLLVYAGGTATAITYNSVAMTKLATVGITTLWGLVNPSSGSNTVALTGTAAAAAISYNGVNQSTPTESIQTSTSGSSAPQSVTITTSFTNDWLTGFISDNGGTPSLISPLIARDGTNNTTFADSNGVVSSGANSYGYTDSSAGDIFGLALIDVSSTGGGGLATRKTLLGVGV